MRASDHDEEDDDEVEGDGDKGRVGQRLHAPVTMKITPPTINQQFTQPKKAKGVDEDEGEEGNGQFSVCREGGGRENLK